MKKRTQKIQSLLKSKDFIYFVICLLLLLAILLIQFFMNSQSSGQPKALSDFIDLSMLTSVVIAFLLTSLATVITHAFIDRFEDVTKLTTDYDKLRSMYKTNTEMLLCRNAVDSYNKKGRKSTCTREQSNLPGDTYIIPVGDVVQLRGHDVVILDNPTSKFTAPDFCREHYAELINAHDSSQTYNQTTLRVEGVTKQNGQIQISFGRSTYFDALITNRAIDFKINGLCVRDLYAHGPFLASLEDSPLSNHMGFNGMVETSDGKFVFVKRHKQVSIGKKTMQCSVAASLKAKYALNKDGLLTKEGIARAIKLEIEDELALTELPEYAKNKDHIFGSFSFENNVLYFYRDLLEGGKPQLMFYAKLNVDSAAIETAYRKKDKKNSKKNLLQKDGNDIICVDRDELRKIYLAPDEIVIQDNPNPKCALKRILNPVLKLICKLMRKQIHKRHPAMPSAVATVVMLKHAMLHGLTKPNVQESFTTSKKGDQASNEDALYVDDRFIAVIDGATSKTAPPEKATMSSGRFAAQTICDLLPLMPPITNPTEMVTWLNEHLKQAIANSVFAECYEGPLASLLLYDSRTKTIISYGDCQFLLGQTLHKQNKQFDITLAHKRASILQAALGNGASILELRQNDIGRAAIQSDLLRYSSEYANEPNGGFPVLGRGDVIQDFIVTCPVQDGETVILASDGYPQLAQTLAESEAKLQDTIDKDPLLINLYKSTKGIVPGNVSYDDRTYIRFTVQ